MFLSRSFRIFVLLPEEVILTLVYVLEEMGL